LHSLYRGAGESIPRYDEKGRKLLRGDRKEFERALRAAREEHIKTRCWDTEKGVAL